MRKSNSGARCVILGGSGRAVELTLDAAASAPAAPSQSRQEDAPTLARQRRRQGQLGRGDGRDGRAAARDSPARPPRVRTFAAQSSRSAHHSSDPAWARQNPMHQLQPYPISSKKTSRTMTRPRPPPRTTRRHQPHGAATLLRPPLVQPHPLQLSAAIPLQQPRQNQNRHRKRAHHHPRALVRPTSRSR